jgi:hypothetical protein
VNLSQRRRISGLVLFSGVEQEKGSEGENDCNILLNILSEKLS